MSKQFPICRKIHLQFHFVLSSSYKLKPHSKLSCSLSKSIEIHTNTTPTPHNTSPNHNPFPNPKMPSHNHNNRYIRNQANDSAPNCSTSSVTVPVERQSQSAAATFDNPSNQYPNYDSSDPNEGSFDVSQSSNSRENHPQESRSAAGAPSASQVGMGGTREGGRDNVWNTEGGRMARGVDKVRDKLHV